MTSALRELSLRTWYRSDAGSIVDDFYVPCLSVSAEYRRAVGYFTSGGLSVAARGLAAFIRGDGRMYLVASPVLAPEDAEAIRRGYAARDDIITKALLRQFEFISSSVEEDRLGCLAWLISEKRLEIKLAMSAPPHDVMGIYHEKVGIFSDREANAVAFIGSPNETVGGLVSNFESIEVFWSWDDPQDRIPPKIEAFDRLWKNDTRRLIVVDFPEAARQALLRFKPSARPTRDPEATGAPPALTVPFPRQRLYIPDDLALRDFQRDAVKAFLEHGARGFFEMATGTGKTVSALAALVDYAKERPSFVVVILCPFSHLVTQWAAEARRFGFDPILCHGEAPRWDSTLANQIGEANAGARSFVCAIATHATGALERFRTIVGHARVGRVLVADEVHHLGAPKLREALENFYDARLGLSATPTRWFDEEGTSFLTKYFGPTLITVTLKDAIAGGFLVPYSYHPHVVELEDDEYAEYQRLTQRIAQLFSKGGSVDDDELLATLLRNRANLLNCARQKLPELRATVERHSPVTLSLFYSSPDQINDVVDLLGNDLGLVVSKFTVEESIPEREALLTAFERGIYQGLVAIRCLDEGVDVPPTRVAYILASSGNPREFIQRRGRILRRAPGKEAAEIHDFLAVPPTGAMSDDILPSEQTILRRELRRFREFADTATNRFTATEAIWHLAERLHVLDF
ncbi:MAG: DEAD/DEAH box helicase family protein [Candidatus Rokubacteria bacterium]|nr:DEAD/DEAH box helicase family protein [Candidatus Rokubacteria bacterium]